MAAAVSPGNSAEPLDPGWQASCVHDLHEWCDEMSLPRVRLPEHAGRLFRSREFDVWSTSDEVSPWLVYGFFVVEPVEGEFARAMDPSAPPLFMLGVAGHGIASWGLGLVAKGNGYSVAIQSGVFSALGDGVDTDGPRGAAMVAAWNRFVPSMESTESESPSLAVFSSFRRFCELFGPGDGDIALDGMTAFTADRIGPGWQRLLHGDAPASDQLAEIRRSTPRGPRHDLAGLLLVLDLLHARPA